MTDGSRVAVASAVGALVGCLAGYVFLTRAGRVLRRRLEYGLEDVARELVRVRTAATGVASEGRKLVDDFSEVFDSDRSPLGARHGASRQTSPF